MSSTAPNPSLRATDLLLAWRNILTGNLPMLSIEITRECPLNCPGCYAYGESHLGGGLKLRDLRDYRGDSLVEGVLELVRKHKPIHVSLVGGEPLVRRRELDRILPELSRLGVFTLVATSAVAPIPAEWMKIPRLRIAVSVDGLPEHHDVRRFPATYERILNNISGREVNIHWVITGPMLARRGYLEEYVSFWNARPEVNRIWVSFYTPQIAEQSPEMLTPEDRAAAARQLPLLYRKYPKLLVTEGMGETFLRPPSKPDDCVFSKMSANYSADLRSQVEPCIFGGSPDCSQCGCAASIALHYARTIKIVGRLKVGHFIGASVRIGQLANRFRSRSVRPSRWDSRADRSEQETSLVQIRP
jgi:MoaA/NifB/PqqE/SkfB family radical SAM enzyme